jgi:ubiquitin carboxyl-terminal hydrolase 16/45
MCPAFKRYLIAVPPPVLVIHLKRFQQLSKTPMMSFSSGFKKLEDFVAFPEYLDIGPFIAPRKEDFGLGKRSRLKVSSKKAGRCMYRLYAVVVHIGNMVSIVILFRLTV